MQNRIFTHKITCKYILGSWTTWICLSLTFPILNTRQFGCSVPTIITNYKLYCLSLSLSLFCFFLLCQKYSCCQYRDQELLCANSFLVHYRYRTLITATTPKKQENGFCGSCTSPYFFTFNWGNARSPLSISTYSQSLIGILRWWRQYSQPYWRG
jgi:hypothetical protein